MIKHDGEWLDQNNASPTDAILCVRYFDHMTRWRTMNEVPEIGSRIEVAYKCEADQPHWSAIEIYSSEGFIDDNPYLCRVDEIGHPYAWRPVGGLPEVVQ